MPKKAARKQAKGPAAPAKKTKKKPKAPPAPLTGKQKSHLRSLAHPLKPVVQIGHQGLTDGVIAALDAALERHELIKVKVSSDAEQDAAELQPVLEKATFAQVAQIIGRTLVVYRRHESAPKIVLPKPKTKRAAAAPPAAAYEEPPVDDEDDDELGADEDDDLE